ncbi:MAG: type II toxin-antitoxin system antitoxin SocA domain-containing protein [Sneathiella sp.]
MNDIRSANYSAITIADEILKIAKRKDKSLTPLQLMKLVYIAHGWSLALRDVDLFPDRIEAWKFGPVIPDLYHATKHFGRKEIPLDRISDEPSNVDGDTRSFLEDVFEKYGHLSGFSLSSLTHKSGTPWDQVYENDVFNIEIGDELIRNHYKAMMNG